MKKNKIISLIFVCAFLVLTFCCSFAGKIVDVEVKPPLRAVGPFTSSLVGKIYKIDFTVPVASFFDSDAPSSTSARTGWFNYSPFSSSSTVPTLVLYDALGNVVSSTLQTLSFGIQERGGTFGYAMQGFEFSTGSMPSTTSFPIYTDTVFYVEFLYDVDTSRNGYFRFYSNLLTSPNYIDVLTNSAFVNSSFFVESSLPTFGPVVAEQFFNNLILGITRTAEDIGVLFSNLGHDLFLFADGDRFVLSTFGVVVSIMLGVSITLGLCNIVLDYILTLGRKKR